MGCHTLQCYGERLQSEIQWHCNWLYHIKWGSSSVFVERVFENSKSGKSVALPDRNVHVGYILCPTYGWLDELHKNSRRTRFLSRIRYKRLWSTKQILHPLCIDPYIGLLYRLWTDAFHNRIRQKINNSFIFNILFIFGAFKNTEPEAGFPQLRSDPYSTLPQWKT